MSVPGAGCIFAQIRLLEKLPSGFGNFLQAFGASRFRQG